MEHVCCYFTFVKRKFQNLSHFYIKLDDRFWRKAMQNKINAKQLNGFKHEYYMNISRQ